MTSTVGNDSIMQVMNQTLLMYQSQQQAMQIQQINTQMISWIDKMEVVKFMKKTTKDKIRVGTGRHEGIKSMYRMVLMK